MKFHQNVLLIAVLLAGFFLLKHHDLHDKQGKLVHKSHTQIDFFATLSKTIVFRFPASPPSIQAPEENAGAHIAERVSGMAAPTIRAMYRISIPYGFDTPLPILADGREVLASGHGGCTADEQVTVTITTTQSSSGVMAMGEDEHIFLVRGREPDRA